MRITGFGQVGISARSAAVPEELPFRNGVVIMTVEGCGVLEVVRPLSLIFIIFCGGFHMSMYSALAFHEERFSVCLLAS